MSLSSTTYVRDISTDKSEINIQNLYFVVYYLNKNMQYTCRKKIHCTQVDHSY